MNILVLNGGSSSIKFSLFALDESNQGNAVSPLPLLEGELSGVSTNEPKLSVAIKDQKEKALPLKAAITIGEAVSAVLDAVLGAGVGEVQAVGHRVVHPGAEIQDHARINVDLLEKLEAAVNLAPLHDPEAITIIHEAMRNIPSVPHFACFDTVFHQTMPEEASTYAIPAEYRTRGIKRYGFHGLSCESVVLQLKDVGPLPSRMVIAHLGSGCSVTALLDGKAIDTTMGLTPTGGIVMGTRPGDLDPGLLLYLIRQERAADAASGVEKMLNHDAGMVALTSLPNDMKAVRHAAGEGNGAAILALKIFTRSVRKAIGSFAWLMGGLDVIVFTGGIGQHDAATRAEVLAGSEVFIDPVKNVSSAEGVCRISASDSKTAVFAVPAQEDLVIALHVKHMLQADT